MAHGHPAVPRTGPEESKIRAGAQRARLQSQETDRYQGHARAAERASALASMNYARSLPHRSSGRPSRFSHSLERRDPYVDGPRAARAFSWSDRIACIDMSGLLMRLVAAGQDGFPRREFQTLQRPLRANGSHGLSRTLDRSILPSTPLAAPAQSIRLTWPTDLLSGGSHRCLGHPRTVVTLACHH